MSVASEIPCRLCPQTVRDYLPDHLLKTHGLTTEKYLEQFPGAPTVSKRLADRVAEEKGSINRKHPPVQSALTIEMAGVTFPINADVPEEVCLPLPDYYQTPRAGGLKEDIQHALVALKHGRSQYVWGMPGSGKDALFHAWSAWTRTPAIIQQVAPGTDIESWFFSRGFNEKGTFWEEGEVLKALRDGYMTEKGRRVPYLLLVSDFDRADREQAEHLRLVTDSIQGRVKGPAGRIYKVLPGTRVAATANSAGGGDERGRMVSANPLDASLLDRFERKINFRWMDWADEELIVKAKFPLLFEKHPSALNKVRDVTKALRAAILNDELHGEFSHRGLCAILGHAQDILECGGGKLKANLLKRAGRTWVDGLPDKVNRDMAVKIMDAHLNTLAEGDRNHKPGDSLLGDA